MDLLINSAYAGFVQKTAQYPDTLWLTPDAQDQLVAALSGYPTSIIVSYRGMRVLTGERCAVGIAILLDEAEGMEGRANGLT